MKLLRFITIATMATGIIVAMVMLFQKGPQWKWFPPCIFYSVTHLHCPGCGSTRALYRLLHGDIGGSLSANILLFPAVLLSLALMKRINHPLTTREYVGIIILYLFYGIARNLSFEPFIFLAPR